MKKNEIAYDLTAFGVAGAMFAHTTIQIIRNADIPFPVGTM